MQTVNPLPFGAPRFLFATAYVSTSVDLYWPPVTDADHYQVFRSSNNVSYALLPTAPSNVFTDATVSSATTYLYRVRAVKSDGTLSGFSPIDPATTIDFVDNGMLRGVTIIKAVHILQLRQAVNLVRASVALPAVSFTDPGLAGTVIKAVHITQLRTALTEARMALALSDVYADDPLVPGSTVVDTTHILDLRDRVQ